jgi:hypothetical protein
MERNVPADFYCEILRYGPNITLEVGAATEVTAMPSSLRDVGGGGTIKMGGSGRATPKEGVPGLTRSRAMQGSWGGIFSVRSGSSSTTTPRRRSATHLTPLAQSTTRASRRSSMK